MNKKVIGIIGACVIGLVGIGFGGYYIYNNQTEEELVTDVEDRVDIKGTIKSYEEAVEEAQAIEVNAEKFVLKGKMVDEATESFTIKVRIDNNLLEGTQLNVSIKSNGENGLGEEVEEYITLTASGTGEDYLERNTVPSGKYTISLSYNQSPYVDTEIIKAIGLDGSNIEGEIKSITVTVTE